MIYVLYIKKGFSLVEVLWGVVILSVVIVTVTGVFTGILVSSKKSEKFVVATSLAEKQVEYIKLTGFSDIPVPVELDGRIDQGRHMHDEVYFPSYPYPQPSLLAEKIDGVTYYYKIKTAYVNDTGNKVISILITVYWEQSNLSGKNSVTLELYKAR